jgi:fructose-bisphosphate aldolase class I
MLRTLVIFGALAASTDAFMGGAPMALTGRTRSKAVDNQRLAVRMTAASPKADRLNTDDDFLPDNSAKMSGLERYMPELAANAKKMVMPGKGLLACDESTGTVGKRLESIGMENNEENRMIWRNLLFTTEGLGEYVSGAILFEETLFQKDPAGKPFVDVLNDAGVIPGIKVDKGLLPFYGGANGENYCTGLDGLYDRAASYYKQGARFCKWRTALEINEAKGMPSKIAVTEAAWGLARYARICQEAGLVPIVEPEILMDGEHTIEKTIEVQTQVNAEVYRACIANGVYLEGSLLKPSMTVPGIECKSKASPEEVAKATIDVLEATVPSKVPGITFLSGGLAEEDASIFLNTMNSVDRVGPWSLTFSFSRAMQSSCLKIWNGKPENVKAAQDQLKARAQANSEANLGKYKAGSQPSLSESLYVKNYVY